jgi:hypothetical protein
LQKKKTKTNKQTKQQQQQQQHTHTHTHTHKPTQKNNQKNPNQVRGLLDVTDYLITNSKHHGSVYLNGGFYG